MADHFYSIAVGEASTRDVSKLTVGTATAGGSTIELRITDGALTRRQAYLICEFLADVFAASNAGDGFPIPVGGFTG